ncbi:MAG: hypothetical protein BGO43_13480 [Gammaproteobacteria bacterium 39-13]|nr:hypothetical protein [Gammaproteobacteria bacterium]OJV85737.1 MAG: hypothetical protein BGO43_13480 [Gammaproteobacteria bacterium 39-13]
MKTKYTLLSFFFFSHITIAALPPTAESMHRIKAVMDSKEVYDKLGSVNWITSITETKEGYKLQSEKCTLMVKVERMPQTMPGPSQLSVKAGELHCK